MISKRKSYKDQTKLLRHAFFLVIVYFKCLPGLSQNDSIWQKEPEISMSGFIDVFYCYDFNEPSTSYRQPFLYNHNRHNEFNLNLGFVKLNVNHLKYRANIALQAGTYVQDNYSSEPELFRHVFEGNAGFSLNKKNNLWLDAGIFGSHIGFETALSKDNFNLTRSLLAENSPYYLAGAKLTYNPNQNLELAAIICNGWQRIKRVTGNSLPAFCTQLKYTRNSTTLNWSTFCGTDDPDSSRRMRYFSNLFLQTAITKKLSIIGGFDFGFQQTGNTSLNYNVWYSPIIIIRSKLSQNWATSLRCEYYEDSKGVIINTGTPNGFATTGVSLNIDYAPAKNILCRIEGRWLNSRDKIFEKRNQLVNDNYFVTASIAVSL